MYRIGVTGGIGSGKSLVSSMLAGYGARVVVADEVARRQAVPGNPVLDELVRVFGNGILGEDGRLDRRALAAIAFADAEALDRLNAVTHPPLTTAIGTRLRELEEAEPDGVAVVDAALLLDWDLADEMDLVVAVVAPRAMRIARMVLGGMSEGEAVARLDAQRPDEWYEERADVVLDNDGTEEDLRTSVERLWGRVQAERWGE